MQGLRAQLVKHCPDFDQQLPGSAPVGETLQRTEQTLFFSNNAGGDSAVRSDYVSLDECINPWICL
jgi:hypothetical protein